MAGNSAIYGAMIGANVAGAVAGIAIPALSIKKSLDEDRGVASSVAHFGVAAVGGYAASSLIRGPGVVGVGALASAISKGMK